MLYTPIPATDANWDIILGLDPTTTKYVITWIPLGTTRVMYGTYHSIARAYQAARAVPTRDAQVCLYSGGVPYFVGVDGRQWRK